MKRVRLALLSLLVLVFVPALATAAGRSPAGAASSGITYTYVVRGLHNSSNVEAFAASAASTYADGRGWNLGGSIAFRRVASGGDFTLWLAAAGDVPGFGAPCDSTYSCTAGRNVVINETRWLNGSPAWNAAGASLSAYRQMVINHETGHWLGFAHEFCAGAGQLAPVMQQQSISLQGCRPNSWPTAAERQRLSASRGVPILLGAPIGSLDAVVPQLAQLYLRGWAIDTDTSGAVDVSILLDRTRFTVLADSVRPDVGAAHPGYGNRHGFVVTRIVAPGRHTVCVSALHRAGPGGTTSLGCRTVLVSGTPIGHLDSVRQIGSGILVQGWALDPDSRQPSSVVIYELPGGRVGVPANQSRPDIAGHYPRWGPNHGFAVLMRSSPGLHRVCAYAANRYGIGATAALGCTEFRTH